MQIVINVPDQYFFDTPVKEFAARIKLYSALFMFQKGQLSAGAACEFSGIDRYAFLDACHRHKIDVMNYDPQELETEFEELKRIMGS